jgi:hypothetical protein
MIIIQVNKYWLLWTFVYFLVRLTTIMSTTTIADFINRSLQCIFTCMYIGRYTVCSYFRNFKTKQKLTKCSPDCYDVCIACRIEVPVLVTQSMRVNAAYLLHNLYCFMPPFRTFRGTFTIWAGPWDVRRTEPAIDYAKKENACFEKIYKKYKYWVLFIYSLCSVYLRLVLSL